MNAQRAVRVGIDVGGTFTHAVAIDHGTLEIIATVCVPTTHAHEQGVARGIAQCLEKLVKQGEVVADTVVFVGHSTTQATNALLEGDVASVGLLGLVQGLSGGRARKELEFRGVPLAGREEIPVYSVFLAPDADDHDLMKSCEELKGRGVGAFVVAQPFAVDDPAVEQRAAEAVARCGLPVTATHQVSGLYGLRARARTSVVNASILPRMVEVSESTRIAVEDLGVTAPLMIMRSDGGVMDAARMAQTPILTILSGPAAGVSAAILHEKISNGIFVEVGGTSTDISLIRNGRPQRKNAVVGGNTLYLETLDVRTVGVAGGSMVRIEKNKVADVGPRSAHIAGLPYACFSDPEQLKSSRLEFIAPREGDPQNYAVLIGDGDFRAAITTTCAANALGLIDDADYAHAEPAAAAAAFDVMARAMNRPAREIATEILDAAARKVADVSKQLIADYDAGDAGLIVVGGGGGASVIAPRAAQVLGLDYRLSANAPVVSAVGVGMALMKELVEQSIVDPTEDDIRRVRSEAIKKLTDAGCAPESIEVEINVDTRKGVVRASATGTSSLVADKKQETMDRDQALQLAAGELKTDADPGLVFEDDNTFVFQAESKSGGLFGIGRKTMHPTAVVDARGLVKLKLNNARIYRMGRDNAAAVLERALGENTIYGDGGAVLKPMHLVYGGKVLELTSAGGPDAVSALATMEMSESAAYNDFCIIAEI